jgi:hypothetical protein
LPQVTLSSAEAGLALDKQIVDAFTLLAVLLVFAIALISGLLPIVDTKVRQAPASASKADVDDLKGQLLAYILLVGLIGLLTIAVFALLLPLSKQAVSLLTAGPDFPTVRAALLMIEAFLLVQLGVTGWLLWRLIWRRRAL